MSTTREPYDPIKQMRRLMTCPLLGLTYGAITDALARDLKRLYIDNVEWEDRGWGEAEISYATWSQDQGRLQLDGAPCALCWELDYSQYNITSAPTLLLYLDDEDESEYTLPEPLEAELDAILAKHCDDAQREADSELRHDQRWGYESISRPYYYGV